MITKRAALERGYFDHGWLKTHHTFSFGDYQDPDFMGFRSLRVINEDWVEPSRGFGTHPHRDMEIITVILEGVLEHKDSMGNGSRILPDDVQRMSAGTGVTHSEFNSSDDKRVHLLQIWIVPDQKGLMPGYEQKKFPRDQKLNQLRLIASKDKREGSVAVHRDVSLYASVLEKGKSITHVLNSSRHAWVQVIQGALSVNQTRLDAGDGAAVSEEALLKLEALADQTEFLLFDLD